MSGNTASTPNGSSRGRRALLSADEVAEWLNLPLRRVRTLTQERDLPSIKIGKAVRYDPAEIEAFIDGRRRPSIDRDPRPWTR